MHPLEWISDKTNNRLATYEQSYSFNVNCSFYLSMLTIIVTYVNTDYRH